MTDTRISIPDGTKIEYSCFENQFLYIFKIKKLIGKGGSCLVYEAEYYDEKNILHECLLKQLYPLHSEEILTDNIFHDDFSHIKLTKEEIQDFLISFNLQKNFRESNDTVNTTSFVKSFFIYNSSYFQIIEKNYGRTLNKLYFDNLHDYISVIRQIVKVVKNYHVQGYLHMDIKPENIFCRITESDTKAITMFDFGSLKKFENISDTSVILSCSKDYAPPELLHLKRNKIGINSDFYEISCMLFEFLFCRFPTSSEISGFSRLKYDNIKMCEEISNECLTALDEFFRHTLTVQYKKRYQTDEEFIRAVDKLYKLSEIHKKYIVSNFTMPSTYFIGRESELDCIKNIIFANNHIIIEGVGGIGKSSLALQYASHYHSEYSTIVYLEYQNSFEDLILNEINIEGISDNITIEEKFKVFRSLCNENTLIILDNLSNLDDEIINEKWLSLPCHVIITTRASGKNFSEYTLTLNGLSEAQQLFYHYYQMPCDEEEKQIIRDLIYIINSHTMMTELLGKLCRYNKSENSSHDCLKEIYLKFQQIKIEEAGKQKVSQLKDWIPSNQSIQKHMDVLFSIFSFNETEQHILQFLSLMPLKSVSQNIVKKWCLFYNSNCINNLICIGIIQNDEMNNLKLHPLIIDRILFNYPPQAKDFDVLFTKLSEAFYTASTITKNMLRQISLHISSHISGISEELARLYLTMVSYLPKKQEMIFFEKSKIMFSQLNLNKMPYYFMLFEIAKKYESLSWLDDDEIKESLIDSYVEICKTALTDTMAYEKCCDYEQLALLCNKLIDMDMMCIDSDKEENFFIYYAEFLKKAFSMADSDKVKKHIAHLLYDFYSAFYNPVSSDVIAEEYIIIADEGIKFYNSETHERIMETEQEHISNLINALKAENKLDKCLKIADEWYEKHFEQDITLDLYLLFQIENLYKETNNWDKYKCLIEEETKFYNPDSNYSLELAEAYFNLENKSEANVYIKKAVEYWYEKKSNVLNYDTECFLLALGMSIEYALTETERCNSEEKFFCYCRIFFKESLMQYSDKLALYCMHLSKIYLKQLKYEKSVFYLIFYARFRSELFIDETEYLEFNRLYDELKLYIEPFEYWTFMYIANYKLEQNYEYEIYFPLLSALDRQIEDNKKNENFDYNTIYDYIQLIYNKIKDYIEDNELSLKIDYERIDELEVSGLDEKITFDEYIKRKIYVVQHYEKVHNYEKSQYYFNKILYNLNKYLKVDEALERSTFYMEQYYFLKNDINNAIQKAQQRYNIGIKIGLSNIKISQICLDIAKYYIETQNMDKRYEWLINAKKYIKFKEICDKNEIKQFVVICESMAEFYEEIKEYQNAIIEYQEIIAVLIKDKDKRNKNKLISICNSLNQLFFKLNNLNQAYYYETFKELILQDNI